MVANYTQFIATDEQEVIRNIDNFLLNYVGWYRLDTITDTATDRDYVWISDGEPDQAGNINSRIIRIRGQGNAVRFMCYSTYTNSITNTGLIFDATDSILSISIDIKVIIIADKERLVIFGNNSSSSSFSPSYVGRILSLFTVAQDPYPNAVRSSSAQAEDWDESASTIQWYALTPSATQRRYKLTNSNNYVDAAAQNTRDNSCMAFSQLLYTDATAGDFEIRGYPRGCYQVAQHFSHRGFITLASGVHIVLRGHVGGTNNFNTTSWVYGPLKDYRIANPFLLPTTGLDIDYHYRGFITEASTVSHWRSAEGINSSTIRDFTGISTLTKYNGPQTTLSPLGGAVDFNGITQYLKGPGSTTYTLLPNSWTCELVINPDTIPVGGSHLIEFGSTSSGTANSSLLSIAITTNSGINVGWQDNSLIAISGTVNGPFINTNRWQYLAITKHYVSSGTQDISVWHAGFGNHEPVLRGSFTLNSNCYDGNDSQWYIAATPELTKYYDGKIDEIRISSTVRTYEEMLTSMKRVKL